MCSTKKYLFTLLWLDAFIVVISQANHRIHPTGCHDTAIHNLEIKKRGTLGENRELGGTN